MTLPHAGAFRLGWVRGENWLDPDRLHRLGDVELGIALRLEALQAARPHPLFRLWPEDHFPLPTRFERDLLFDHVEKLESN